MSRAWIATQGARVYYFSEEDGWVVDQVVGPFPAKQAEPAEAVPQETSNERRNSD